jgi:hypothetical protein
MAVSTMVSDYAWLRPANPTLYYSSHAVGGVANNIDRCQNSW